MSSHPALAQFVRGISLFSLVGEEDMHEVLRLLRPVELSAGDVLFRQGEPGRAMWVLGQGVELSLSSATPQGRPVAVAYAREGDVVGEMALVDDGARSATAVVVAGGHAHEIDAQEFHAMRSTYVPAAYKMLRKISVDLCTRLRSTTDRIVPPGHAQVVTPRRPGGGRPPVELLEDFPAFRPLPAVVKLALSQKLELIALDDVAPIFAEGEPTDGAYFVLEGEVSVGRNGKTVAQLGPGTMFGIVACIDQGLRSASCVTTGPARLLRMSDRDFDQLFATGNRFAFQMVDLVARQLVQHLREANRLLPQPGAPAGTARLAAPLGAPRPPEQAPAAEPRPLGLEATLPIEVELNLGA